MNSLEKTRLQYEDQGDSSISKPIQKMPLMNQENQDALNQRKAFEPIITC